MSRRHWLLTLLTGLGGSWLARFWPGTAAAAVPAAASPQPAAPRPSAAEPLPQPVTYAYDCNSYHVYAQDAGSLSATFTYDPDRGR
jgi:hypothetical protein